MNPEVLFLSFQLNALLASGLMMGCYRVMPAQKIHTGQMRRLVHNAQRVLQQPDVTELFIALVSIDSLCYRYIFLGCRLFLN